MAHQGETIVIAKAGKPYLDLIPHKGPAGKWAPGKFAGKIRIADDFDDTPDDLVAAFKGP